MEMLGFGIELKIDLLISEVAKLKWQIKKDIKPKVFPQLMPPALFFVDITLHTFSKLILLLNFLRFLYSLQIKHKILIIISGIWMQNSGFSIQLNSINGSWVGEFAWLADCHSVCPSGWFSNPLQMFTIS